MAFSEKLAAMRAKQESADSKKKEAAEMAAAETAKQERESKKTELQAERERVSAELTSAEGGAAQAEAAIKEAEAFAAEQGENLDVEAKAEIDSIKAEANEAVQKFEKLKTELARIDTEIGGMEEGGSAEVEDTKTEVVETKLESQDSSNESASTEIEDKNPEQLMADLKNFAESTIKEVDIIAKTSVEKLDADPKKTDSLKKFKEELLDKFITLAQACQKNEQYDRVDRVVQMGRDFTNKIDSAISNLVKKINPKEAVPSQTQLSSKEADQFLKLSEIKTNAYSKKHPRETKSGLTEVEIYDIEKSLYNKSLSPDGAKVLKSKMDTFKEMLKYRTEVDSSALSKTVDKINFKIKQALEG